MICLLFSFRDASYAQWLRKRKACIMCIVIIALFQNAHLKAFLMRVSTDCEYSALQWVHAGFKLNNDPFWKWPVIQKNATIFLDVALMRLHFLCVVCLTHVVFMTFGCNLPSTKDANHSQWSGTACSAAMWEPASSHNRGFADNTSKSSLIEKLTLLKPSLFSHDVVMKICWFSHFCSFVCLLLFVILDHHTLLSERRKCCQKAPLSFLRFTYIKNNRSFFSLILDAIVRIFRRFVLDHWHPLGVTVYFSR